MKSASTSSRWDEAYRAPHRFSHRADTTLLHLIELFVGDLAGQRVLEFGCGVGNQAAPLLQAGAHYFGVDGSQSAVDQARAKYGEVFACCDFTEGQPFEADFDVVIDRASISHNDSLGVLRAVNVARDALKSGGIFIGVDWFSTLHDEFGRGTTIDERTRSDYPDGQFAGIGQVHFTDEDELTSLFVYFDRLFLEQRVRVYPAMGKFLPHAVPIRWVRKDSWGKQYIHAVWDMVARKP